MGVDFEQQMSRKEYQRLLDKRRQRRLRRRRARIRRSRAYRSLRSMQFWSRAMTVFGCACCAAFWARFAFVYDIPPYAMTQLPQHVVAYVTVKPWWFGPPVFDIGQYASMHPDMGAAGAVNPYHELLLQMGKYESVLRQPAFIWVLKR